MKVTKRAVILMVVLGILVSQLCVPASGQNYGDIHSVLGDYEGTVEQNGYTEKIYLSILETSAVAENLSVLEMCIDRVNAQPKNSSRPVDAEAVWEYVVSGKREYFGLMYSDNPYIGGVCVTGVSYNEANNTYFFGSSKWFPEDYYGYTNLEKMTYQGGVFTGEQWSGGSSQEKDGDVTLTRVSQQVPQEQPYTLAVYSDYSTGNIEAGDIITLQAGVWDGEQYLGDPSGITFQLTNSSAVKILDSGIRDQRFWLQLHGEVEGETVVTFSDSLTGLTASIPITVSENNYATYTLSNVPVHRIGDFDTNFFDFNGLFIDCYSYTVDEDRTAHVSFDVYNANQIYGMVEVYNEAGELENAVLINKMTGLNSSIKEVVWDGMCCFVRDCISGHAMTYRQETNFSVLTPVELDIPQNGYIKITTDPLESNILAVVNSVDFLTGVLSLVGELKKFDTEVPDLPQKLTKQMLEESTWEHLRQDGSKFFTNIDKDLAKEVAITSKTIGDFTDTLSRQLSELNLMEVVQKSLLDSGASFAEDVFKDLAGICGYGLDLVFVIGQGENTACQYIDYLYSVDTGVITLQNQGGGLRSAGQVRLESNTDFDPETAAQVFTVALSDQLLEQVRQADAETYEMLTKGIMHTYSISLLRGGEKVQHTDAVTVYIPIPEELRVLSLMGNISVYRIEEDGTLTNMYAVVEDGCMKFTTDHFSLYALVNENAPAAPQPSDAPDEEGKTGQSDVAPSVYGIFLTVGGISTVVLAAGVLIGLLVAKRKHK